MKINLTSSYITPSIQNANINLQCNFSSCYFIIFLYIFNKSSKKVMQGNSDAVVEVQRRSRVKKMSQADIIFKCECGRAYLTFSALYLHAKNKHNIRITIKKHEHKSVTEIESGKKIITYYLHTQPDYIQNQEQEIEITVQNHHDFATQLESFHSQTKEKVERDGRYILQKSKVLQNLQTYFKQIVKINDSNNELSQDMTLYFNDYLLQFRNRADQNQRSVDVHVQIEILVQLWKWLKLKGLTAVELKKNQEYMV